MPSAQAEKLGRHDRRDLVGVGAGGPQHRAGILGAGSHPGLGQDVLAGLERADRDRRVEHRPGADQDRVELRVRDELLPGRIGAREPELIGRATRRLLGAVGDPDQLDAVDGAEARDVLARDDPAGADDPDADGVGHGRRPFGVAGVLPAGPGPVQPRRRDRSSAAVRTTAPAATSLVGSVRLSGQVAMRSPTTRPRASRTGADDPDRALVALAVADDVAAPAVGFQLGAEPGLAQAGAAGHRVRQPVEDGRLLVGRQEGQDALAR